MNKELHYTITGRIEIGSTGLINFYDEKGHYKESLMSFMDSICQECGEEYEASTGYLYKIKNALVSLYISKTPRTYEEMVEAHINNILGIEYATDWVGYSEFTIEDIWVDTLTVGGHDLLRILHQYNNHFITLSIKIV